ncbi:MAG: hypothetical protein ABL907_00180, partial [Hyphomicrobium sp.]
MKTMSTLPALSKPVGKIALTCALATAVLLLTGFDSLAVRLSSLPVGNYCYYRLAQSLPVRTDVLLIGTSRVLQGIEPDELGKSLSGADRSAAVVNFAHPGHYLNFDYRLLEELLGRTQAGVVVIEVPFEIEKQVQGKFQRPRKEGRKRNPNPVTLDLKIERPRKEGPKHNRNPVTPDLEIEASTFAQLLMPGENPAKLPTLALAYQTLRYVQTKIDRSMKLVLTGRVFGTLTNYRERPMDGRNNICYAKMWTQPKFHIPKPDAEERK